jgi:hypothetical protein
MLTRSIRKSLRRQEGQALVLAALMMLVLSLAVLSTVNIGHALHNRIRLQDTADAAAYSMAAMEARAFNFYAYANRAQVSHYVSAMMWQSLVSLIYFNEAFLTDVYGITLTLSPCKTPTGYFWENGCPALNDAIRNTIPALTNAATAFANAEATFVIFLKKYQDALAATNPDAVIGREVIPAHRVLNSVLFYSSQAVMYSAATHVGQTTNAVIQDNDPNVNPLLTAGITDVLNQCLFDRAHYRDVGDRPLAPTRRDPFIGLDVTAVSDSSRVSIAKRTMGAISNATRYACDDPASQCPVGFVTNRKIARLVNLNEFGAIREYFAQDTEYFTKLGQTRFLTYNNPNADKVLYVKKRRGNGNGHEGGNSRKATNYIRSWRDTPSAPVGMLAQGDNIGSDDLYWVRFGPDKLVFPDLTERENPFACAKGGGKNDFECWGDPRLGEDDNPGDKQQYQRMLKPSVWALNLEEEAPGNGGVHWRVNYPDNPENWEEHAPPDADTPPDKAQLGLNMHQADAQGLLIDVYTANVAPVGDFNHPWKGLVPFMHFEPGQYQQECNPTNASANATVASMTMSAPRATYDFNQPSTWVYLHKTAEQVKNANGVDPGMGTNAPALVTESGKVEFKFSNTSQPLDTNFTNGISALARGQTYYHRPGNWSEQPNFFNPYWRPRLASVFQARNELPLVNAVVNGLPDPLRSMPNKVITH